ncbi:MAG TPA: hypothetical protein VIG30_08565 [Ktedonobacterales bacterium]
MSRFQSYARLVAPLVALAFVVVACGSSTTIVQSGPTATRTPAPSCATLLPGASAAAAPAGFTGLQFPTGAVMTAPHSSYGATGQFAIQQTDVCYAGTPDQVNGPFSGHSSVFAYLFGSGWGTSTTYPLDGQTQKPCTTGANCFHSGDEHYLSFENLTSPLTGFVTYHLRLGAPPPAPTCDPTFFGPSVSYSDTFGAYALPPLTKVSPAAGGEGFPGGTGTGFCSAGTSATILAFMQASAIAAGDTPRQITATSFCVSVSSGGFYGQTVFVISSGNQWDINEYHPIASTPQCS